MKRIIIGILAISCVAVMGGCAAGNADNPAIISQADTARTSELDMTAAADSSAYIGEGAAKAIVLEHAGVTESEVTYVRANLDYDDGQTVYDIEFYIGNAEYDYKVDAVTGDILSYDYDIESYTASSAPNDDGSYISLDEAKAIALGKANLTADQITYTKASFEYDDGLAVYQIDFISGGMEYEVEINAADGTVVEYDAESQYD